MREQSFTNTGIHTMQVVKKFFTADFCSLLSWVDSVIARSILFMKCRAFWQLVTLFLKKENRKCQPL